jgi:hypothetical protein
MLKAEDGNFHRDHGSINVPYTGRLRDFKQSIAYNHYVYERGVPMIAILTKAAENFCVHQIRMPHTVSEAPLQTRTVVAYIDVNKDDGGTSRVYTVYETTFMQMVAEIFLFEEESDYETLQDMALETANMIIGSAKVLAAETGSKGFSISTPHLEDADSFINDCDTTVTIALETTSMQIAIKDL